MTAPNHDDSADARSRPESLRQWSRSLRALDLEVATRATLAMVIPLIVLVLVGRIDWAVYASFGGMTALFGRSEPYRLRARSVSVAAVGMVGSIGFGLILAVFGAPLGLLTAGLIVVLVLGVLLVNTMGLFPSTALFFVFAYTVCAQVPTEPDQVLSRLLVGLVGAAFAWMVTMSGWLLRRAAPERSAPLFKRLPRQPRVNPAAYRDGRVWLSIGQMVVGSLVAGGLAILVGIGHPYWAVVSVVAVMPPPGARHSTSRAFHRIFGTALGVLVTALVLVPGPPVWVLILVIAIGQFGAEILIGKHYGAALLFITPLALTVSHLGSPVPVSELLVDRVVETALGGAVAVILVVATRAGLARATRRSAVTP
ncbi:FUSC family protein [Cryobacterium adonitolivorans]|uniref:FUSC family protein n=1 Tax=Cryobacterium adonitolivorans TaxID=1259189 RepID=A0A4R8W7E5_9MICO|nr:FUSC family protein [Cryobacterium adonitolivorans]TFC03737.1 FUSC family protein [Cryobacterium adonitolivorans]